MNNPYDVFSFDKNITPFIASNANLDKIFSKNIKIYLMKINYYIFIF